MRVGTNTIYQLGAQGLQKHISDQAKLQNQLSTGRRVLTPADDPIASSRILDIAQSQALNEQYKINSNTADSSLRMTEATLKQVTDLIHDVSQLAVTAGNPALTGAEKKMLDSELQGRYKELLGLANATDGNGLYLFSGYKGDTKPYTEATFGNVVYNGDDGQRLVQISQSRNIPVSDSGNDVFSRIKNGNGTFVTAQANSGAPAFTPTNKGSGIVSPGEVVDPAKWNALPAPRDFKVQFYWQPNATKPDAPTVTYDLIDSTGTSLIDGQATPRASGSGPRAYVPGGDIEFKQIGAEAWPGPATDLGIKLSVTGTPLQVDPATKVPVGAPGAADAFTVAASTNVDLFKTLGDLSTALTTYTIDGTGNGQAAFQNQLNTALSNLSNSLTNVLTVQASIGARMNETDSVRDTNADMKIQYAQTLRDLRDLDYAEALSDFAQNQTLLDAARKSFAQVQSLSLFQYIN
ncbi:flagellar hook-associated protein FlgL [Chitinilyticum aquatile]|uniref:flagellar hook-associated protein FlgL n=1 Tax=Chitinilyticum aquatile TaxID=362520 RepID=UPI0004061BEF|nr:flagellar hook-associated protein FlgL [Chitinilyticum aquatile]